MSQGETRRWRLGALVALLVVGGALEVWDQRPILAQDAPAPAVDDPRAPFALLELFTSEGCSSCPAADDLLREVSSEARERGQRVFALAFHVDYWDYLGWKDPFAQAAFTARQRTYARALQVGSLYTPQLVVNGREQLVGSRRSAARAAVAAALERPAALGLTLRLTDGASADEVRVTCALDAKPPAGARLQVALVERGLVSEVPSGENAGRTLPHDEVVRALRAVDAKPGEQELTLSLPTGLARERAAVIGFVSDKGTLAVLGAARVELAPTRSR